MYHFKIFRIFFLTVILLYSFAWPGCNHFCLDYDADQCVCGREGTALAAYYSFGLVSSFDVLGNFLRECLLPTMMWILLHRII